MKLLSLAITAATLISSTSVFAASSSNKTIPAHMDPGTVIQYDKNNNMQVVVQGLVKYTDL